jgi:hypothetical protein
MKFDAHTVVVSSETGDFLPPFFLSPLSIYDIQVFARVCVCGGGVCLYMLREESHIYTKCLYIKYLQGKLSRSVSQPCLESNVCYKLCFSSVDQTYNLGEPSDSKDVDPGCSRGIARAVSFGINTNFLVAIIVCIAILLSKC